MCCWKARRGGRVRIWSAGCSNGHEPYSIALTIHSLMPDAAEYDIKVLEDPKKAFGEPDELRGIAPKGFSENNAEVAGWLKTADTNTDPAVRRANYSKAIKKITEQAYWLPMFSGVRSYGWDSNLDFVPYADEIPRFYLYSWK